MDDGAIRTGILVLIISALGTGVLTLHHFYDSIGILIGTGVMAIVAGMFIFSSDVLIFALKKSENAKSLNQLIENLLGKASKIIFDVLIFIYLFLAMVSILLTVSKTFYLNFGRPIMEKYFHYNFIDEQDFKNHFKEFNTYFAFVAGFVIFFLII